MRRVALLALILCGCVFLLAACGGGKTVTPTPNTVEGTVPKPTTTPTATTEGPKGDPVAGKAVFASAGCTACHTLKAAGSTGTVGPNLDDRKPELSLILDRVHNGKGAMPPFKGNLTEQQIADVAAFVFQSTHG